MKKLYALFLFFPLLSMITDAQDRNLTSVIVSTSYTYISNTTVQITFDFDSEGKNNPGNLVVYHSMTFPSGVTVNSASDIYENVQPQSLLLNSISGSIVDWGDPALSTTNGYLRVRKKSTFSVYVTINASFSGDMVISYTTKDNLYGNFPHI